MRPAPRGPGHDGQIVFSPAVNSAIDQQGFGQIRDVETTLQQETPGLDIFPGDEIARTGVVVAEIQRRPPDITRALASCYLSGNCLS